MLFNSIDFSIFLPIVFILYWFVVGKSIKLQNLLIVISSYVFYGWWDWYFLLLIAFSTFVDYIVGLKLSTAENRTNRVVLLSISIASNIGLLLFFKYSNFFVENFISAFSFFGCKIQGNLLHIILPVGISFYTFQTLSYTIDIYRKKLKPTNDLISFAAYVSFFPQLVAGPIERATNLLPQFYRKRTFDYSNAVDGMRQILWGLAKKIIIADNCAETVNLIFNNSDNYTGSTLLLGAIFFAFQIYGDFSGYSDIAIGTARLFGFNLMQNFSFPYFSRDIAEFWRRWHISLSTWFRDYLYIPLGGSKGNLTMRIRNMFIIFIISGFWHGAKWNYIVWGALNALYFLPMLLTNKNRKNLDIVAADRLFPNFKEVLQILSTFFLTIIAWIFFRADNITHAIDYISEIFSSSIFTYPNTPGSSSVTTLFLIITFIILEWFGRKQKYAFANVAFIKYRPIRLFIYYTTVFLIFHFAGKDQQFIYFQF